MIKLENIHKQFGDTEVLKGIDLEINQGEIIVIIGSSGTGKSTLLRCVNFLEQADQGKISIDDINVDVKNTPKPRYSHCVVRPVLCSKTTRCLLTKRQSRTLPKV